MIFLNTIFIYLTLKAINKDSYTKKEQWIFFVSGTTIISILYNAIGNKFRFYPLVAIIIYILLSLLVLKNKIYKSVIGVGIYYILAGIGETISYLIFVYQFDYNPEYVRKDTMINIVLHLLTYLTVFLFLLVFNVWNSKEDIFLNYKKQASILITSTILIFTLGTVSWFYDTLDQKTLVLINLFLTFVFLLVSIIYILILQKVITKSEENKELKTYIELTQELSEDLRRFKHNYMNLLYALGGYIEHKEWRDLENYYVDLIKESREVKSNNLFSIQNIKNSALFGLISQKIKKASEMSVDIVINIPNEVEDLGIRDSSICEVLGVYFDNAIESASETNKKCIVFEVINEEESIDIVMKNTFNNKPDLNKIFEKGYTTKKSSGKGLGLYFAKKILERYENVLYNTYIKDDMFVQEIIINKEK